MSILWHLRETYRILSMAADAHKRLADSERESERDDRAMKNMAMAEAYDRSARLVGLVLQEAERRRVS